MDLCYFVVVFTLLSCLCRSLVVTCCERADLLTLLYVKFSCVFVTYSYGVLSQVWKLILSIPDLFLLPYFICRVLHFIVLFAETVYRPGCVFGEN